MSRDSVRGQLLIPFRCVCRAARCKSYVMSWTTSGERAEVEMEHRGWKKKRGDWCCPKHVKAPINEVALPDARLKLVKSDGLD